MRFYLYKYRIVAQRKKSIDYIIITRRFTLPTPCNVNFHIIDVMSAILHFSIYKINTSFANEMRRLLEVFHHTYSITRRFSAYYYHIDIISIIRICMGAKLHNTVSRNDRSRYTRIDPFRERFSITGTLFFSRGVL